MKFVLFALLIFSVLSCQEKSDKDANDQEEASSEQKGASGKAGGDDGTAADADKAIWKPEVGDTWIYQVVVEVPDDAKIPDEIEGQKIEKLDGKIRSTYKQTSVYKGLMPMKDDGPEAHAFYVSNGKQLEEIEYMKITDVSVEALGSKGEGKTPKDVIILSKPVPLVMSNWKGGEAFPLALGELKEGKKASFVRQFRVLGWETLETAAGKFEALHVQVTGLSGSMEIKRGYWFTPGVGFIKEAKKYYLGDKTIFVQTRVLAKVMKNQP